MDIALISIVSKLEPELGSLYMLNNEDAGRPERIVLLVAASTLKSVKLFLLLSIRLRRYCFEVILERTELSMPIWRFVVPRGSLATGGVMYAISMMVLLAEFCPDCTLQLDGYCIVIP